jgi:hypothetical protein
MHSPRKTSISEGRTRRRRTLLPDAPHGRVKPPIERHFLLFLVLHSFINAA